MQEQGNGITITSRRLVLGLITRSAIIDTLAIADFTIESGTFPGKRARLQCRNMCSDVPSPQVEPQSETVAPG